VKNVRKRKISVAMSQKSEENRQVESKVDEETTEIENFSLHSVNC
jgi:hypothetical protein